MSEPLLDIRGLRVRYGDAENGPAVDQVSLSLRRGHTLALLGESGGGKSTVALAVLRLLPRNAVVEAGEIRYLGRNVMGMDSNELRGLRGRQIGLVLQESMCALNPVLTVGTQLGEVMKAHGQPASQERVGELLSSVGLEGAIRRAYPHMLSGGMRQRVGVALALAVQPQLLIADEPTRGLDPTVQWQLIELLRRLQRGKNLSLLLIGHELGVAAQLCEEVAVMCGGRIVEQGRTESVFANPAHPFSQAMRSALPDPGHPRAPIAGPRTETVVVRGGGCCYRQRCPRMQTRCEQEVPALVPWTGGHTVACFNPGEGT